MSKKIKVLHSVYCMDKGGIEVWLMNMFRNLKGHGVVFDFVVNIDKKAFFDKEIIELGGRIFYVGRLNNPFVIYRETQKILKRNSYNSVHCHNVESAFPVLLAAKQNDVKRRIYQSHNNFKIKLKNLSRIKKYFLLTQNNLSKSICTDKIAVSEQAGESLFGKGDENFKVFSLGIDFEIFNPQISSGLTKENFGFNNDDIVIGHVGRFDQQKNHEFILKIADVLCNKNPRVKFLLIGNGNLFEQIKKDAKDMNLLDNVLFEGVRDDVPNIMKDVIDVFLFPSISEGLGLVLVEAQASGIQILCSDSIQQEAMFNLELLEIMTLDRNEYEWSSKIEKMINTESSLSKNNAYKKALESPFNINKAINNYLNIWGN